VVELGLCLFVSRQGELAQLRGVEAVLAGAAIAPAQAKQLARDPGVDDIELAAVALGAANHVL
jgi:hypothetical protein